MTIPDLEDFKRSLEPLSESLDSGKQVGQAAVLVPLLMQNNEWHILLTRRADALRYHSGEVAFPGGMWEEHDRFPVDTALRESHEEIGLEASNVKVLGLLKTMQTRSLTKVCPVVGSITGDSSSLSANTDEIAAIFSVPITFFLQDQRLRTDVFNRKPDTEAPQWVPAYQYDDYEIWGFTSAVIGELLRTCFETSLVRENSAPEKHWY